MICITKKDSLKCGDIMDSLEVLNEMYFGKVPELLIAENLLNEFKEKCMKVKPFFEFSIDDKVFKKLKNDEMWIKLSNCFSKMFGFKAAYIELVEPSMLFTGNAYTYICPGTDEKYIPLMLSKTKQGNKKYKLEDVLGKAVIVNNKGFYIDKNQFPAVLITFISLDWFFRDNLTGGNILAVLLHEIGHNFTRIIHPIRGNTTSRIDERFADRFVAMYGYSTEYIEFFKIIPSLSSLRPFNFIINNIPILNLYLIWLMAHMELVFWQTMLFSNTFSPFFKAILLFLIKIPPDPHPLIKTRMKSQLEQLESDLKMKNLSPAMKKEIKEKIKETRKAMESSIKYDGTITGLGPWLLNLYMYFIEPFAPIDYLYDKYSEKTDSPDKVNEKLDSIYKGDRYDEKGEKITNGSR